MSDIMFKSRLAEALREPPVPEALIVRTVSRVKAVTAGRRAEERLSAPEAEALPPEEKTLLAAAGLIGRLAQLTPLPDSPTAEALAARLAENPVFKKQTGRSASETLAGLQSGALLKQQRELLKGPGKPKEAEKQKPPPRNKGFTPQ